MIPKLPGWLNFIVLANFYLVLAYELLKLFTLWAKLFYPFFGIGSLFFIYVITVFAGAYLSKWREKQGGGWRFW